MYTQMGCSVGDWIEKLLMFAAARAKVIYRHRCMPWMSYRMAVRCSAYISWTGDSDCLTWRDKWWWLL